MTGFGYPADSLSQSTIHAVEESAPAAPIAPHAASGSSAASLSAPRGKAGGWEAPAVTVLAGSRSGVAGGGSPPDDTGVSATAGSCSPHAPEFVQRRLRVYGGSMVPLEGAAR